ncbi:TIGR03943 family putative permease subunit [Psychrobacillus soli]|uniref:TIGR03943 family protein n=1 Tax=Psychrobacillus soli TaxID=1543965 RepID=A0A544SKT5_9BACI|nr:TIGR03943 family protein [Psychrobacillus soli]TQR05799.1 TIGR03943 family protein [Psychrobacillus soli]
MRKEPDYKFHVFLRGVILIGFFLLLFKLLISGDIQNLIAPKMIPFSYFSVLILLVLGIIQIWRSGSKNSTDLFCNCGFDHNNTGSFFGNFFIYSLFLLPLLIGFWFPDTVLDSSIAAKRGINYGANLSTQNAILSDDAYVSADITNKNNDGFEGDSRVVTDPLIENNLYAGLDENEEYKNREELKNELLNSSKIVVKDEYYLDTLDIIVNNINAFVGKEIELIGFVFKEPDLQADQFVVARFAISCCIADSTVFGIIASANMSHPVVSDEWIRTTGIISKTTVDDWELPMIQVTEVERIDQPEDPYVYEIYMPY